MRLRSPTLVSLALIAGAVVSPTPAYAAPAALHRVATRSVAAATTPTGARTAFAFGSGQTIIANTAADGAIRLTSSSGITAIGESSGRDGSLVAIRDSGLALTPLRQSSMRMLRTGASAYVIGPPLGYETQKIRPVRLPSSSGRSDRRLAVEGRLPSAFAGAPVLTHSGRLIGAVARIGGDHWILEPATRLRRLVASAGRPSGGGGLSILLILAAALIVILVVCAAGVLWAKRSRQRAFEATRATQNPPVSAVAQRPREPLVRLRSPVEDPADDFEVVLKPQGDDS